VTAFHRGRKGQHFILGGPDVTWLQVSQEIARILNKPGPRWRLPNALFKAYGWSEFLISSALRRNPMLTPHTIDILSESIYSDSTLAGNVLDYKSSTLREMLEDCHQWMLKAGMLS
jgi:dihydroflavonol-4-reductase